MARKVDLPPNTKVPNHIVIIPDGNRRWARARGLEPSEGHKMGAERVKEIARVSRGWGIHTLTFWGLSTENWRERSTKEVHTLIKIIGSFIDDHLEEAKRDDVRFIHLGRKDRLPKILIDKIKKAERETVGNSQYVFNLALDYGGQDEVVRAIQKIIKDKVEPESVDIKFVDSYMDTNDQPYPYPDLIIRTSGEQRTSGILLWQSHYAETYWEHDHLPAITPEKFRNAIVDYSYRRRRFGGNDAENHLMFKPEVSARLELNWWRLQNIPEGTSFRQYAIEHLREQWGLSKELGFSAAKYMVEAARDGKKEDWQKAGSKLKKFYKLIKDEVKLAFEPSIAASLEVKLMQKINGGKKANIAEEIEGTTRQLLSEVYRISDFQAAKAAHLRALATEERARALRGEGEEHWERAEDYLQKYYTALKDRVA